jgi:hypothetical protein
MFAGMLLAGCTTVAIYQSPVSKFQSAVNSANSGIRTYLLGVDDVVAKRHLYAKAATNGDWALSDFTSGGISSESIQLRLQALDTIAAYANALGAVAESKDVANLQQAAQALGTNVNNLNATIKTIDAGDNLADLQQPIESIVELFQIPIEISQKNALESAINNAASNVDLIIQRLAVDLPKFAVLVDTSENGIWDRKLTFYNEMRKSSAPKDIDGLITQVITDYDNLQTLKHAGVGSLLTDMRNAHGALVVFAKSSKTPKDLADLSGQIDVFASHVQLFNNALSSIQKVTTSSK